MESQFEKRLKLKLELMRDMVIQSMTEGGYADFSEYKYNLGYLQALKRVNEEIEATQDELRNG